ncbi:hypothetical protein J6590_089134 [Homalodisca vitripennis]|nr:hypothetical protein J6590_089134 [Homalodisca vitripennis]
MSKIQDHLILSWIEEDEETFPNLGSDSEQDAPSEHSLHDSNTEQSGESDGDLEDANVSFTNLDAPSTSAMDIAVHEPVAQPVREPGPIQVQSRRQHPGPVYVGKDTFTKWYIHKSDARRTKTSQQNIIKKLPGVKGAAKNSRTIFDSWKLFFPDQMIQNIVNFTNDELDDISSNYARDKQDCPNTNVDELLSFFGVLYMLGVKKGNHLNTK